MTNYTVRAKLLRHTQRSVDTSVHPERVEGCLWTFRTALTQRDFNWTSFLSFYLLFTIFDPGLMPICAGFKYFSQSPTTT